MELAARNHPQLQAASALQQGAEAGILTARAYPNPEAGYLAGNQRPRIPGAVAGLNQVYSFAQPIETRAVRDKRLRTAELGRDSSGFTVAESALQVRAAVRQAFYLALRRQEEIALSEGNLKLIEDLRRRIQAQVDAGEAPRLELTRAEAELATARILVQSAKLRLNTALAALRAAVGASLPPEIEPVGSLDPAVTLPSLEVLLAEVMARYPALQQAQAEVRRAGMRLETEKALRTPQPTLRAEYEQQPDVATYRVGLSLPVPVWNKRAGPIGEAAAAVRLARAAAEVRRLELTAALQSAHGRYLLASQQIASFEQGALRLAEAALRAAEAAYRFGERGIIEVLDAQRMLRNTRMDLLNARYDRQSALIDIEQLSVSPAEGMKP